MACEKVIYAHENKLSSDWLVDLGKTVYSSINYRPSTKGHFVILTKRHTEDLRTMARQEWAEILPVLKDGIAKIENYHKYKSKPGPLGYRISMPTGELGNQDNPVGQRHF